jgi:hypothetical protein
MLFMTTYSHGYAKQGGQWWFWFNDGRKVRAGEVQCKQCGRQFPTYRGAAFCSVACRAESTRKAVEQKRCQRCGKRFNPKESEQRFCSHRCAATEMHAKRIAPVVQKSGDKNPAIPKEKAHRFTQDATGQWWYHFGQKRPCRVRAFLQSCPRCGREFIPTPIKRKDSKPTRHCSRECGIRAAYDKPEVRERFKGERSHLWKGGRKRTERGYIAVHCPGHPSIKFGARRYVLEHRLGIENLELWVGGHPPGQRVDEKA